MHQRLPTRSTALGFLVAGLAMAACSAPQPVPPPPASPSPPSSSGPQVVLVTLDTLRADHLGCYGYDEAHTPNLDALAARGARFTAAYTPTPLTIPAHASLFTGLLPPRHGIRDNGDYRLPAAAHTLAEMLSEAGWRCQAAVGAFVTQSQWGFGQGFERYRQELGVPSDRLSWRAERRAEAVVDDALLAVADGADFLWVHLFDAHAPYAPPAPFQQGFSHPYDGEIAYLDAQLGRLLEVLPPATTVVVVGDHGEGLGEGGEEHHGLLLEDATVHVPLLVVGPGITSATVDRPVSLMDVTPTILRLAGLPPEEGMDGHDLFQPARSPGVYSETLYGHHHFGWTPLRSVITPDGRLVQGAREEGDVSPEARRWMVAVSQGVPQWASERPTLDLAEIEQLQALGYLGTPDAPPALGVAAVDPRDGIQQLARMEELGRLPPGEQEATLRDLLRQFPSWRDARFRLATLLAHQGRLDDARAEMASVYGVMPDSTAALSMGELWLQSDNPDEALQWYREAALLDPNAPAALAGEVECLVDLGALDEARAVVELALQRWPDHGRLLLAGALLALAGGEPLQPWAGPVTSLAHRRPFEPRYLQVAATLQAALGESEAAIALYRQELRWRPGNLAARLDLAALFADLGRQVDVVKTLRPLLALQPDEPRWHALAARAYLAMGRADLAEPHRSACAGLVDCP